MLKSLFVKTFQQNMSLSQRNLRGGGGGGGGIDRKHNGIQNITHAPTFTSTYIVLCIRDGVCQNLSS